MSDLIHKIVGKIIEVGQSDTTKFRLGETIRYSPSEILEILKQHESEIFGEGSSTQTNTPNTLNALDTISRQAAIDAVCMEWCNVKHQNCEHPFDIEKDDYYWCDGCETALQTLPSLPSVQPKPDEWCTDCKEYDPEKHCCPRFNRVIRNALKDAQPERKSGKWIVHPEVKNVYGGTYIECSQCGEKYVVQHMEDEKYCRNCGAKMEK